ncbi:MAG: hypothetical protein IKU47_03290 [Oscillospiraceae bacterium]|nr:hypothetical protein [Oscillospiraceae bacterium]
MKDFEPKTDNIGKFKVGTKFIGNINNCLCEVVDIQNNWAFVKDLKTGKTIMYGLQSLERCYLTIIA